MKTVKMKCVATLGWKFVTNNKIYEIYKIRYDGYQTLFFIFGDDKIFHWIPCTVFEPITEGE